MKERTQLKVLSSHKETKVNSDLLFLFLVMLAFYVENEQGQK